MTPSMKQHTKPQPKTAITYLQNNPKIQSTNKSEDKSPLVGDSPGHLVSSSSLYAIMLQLNTFFEEKLVKEI